MNSYTVLGLMSGTSLDGLDMSIVHFKYEQAKWHYAFGPCYTKVYDDSWHKRLQIFNATKQQVLNANELLCLERDYSLYLASSIDSFLEARKINKSSVHFIASHGHTLFHEPQKGITKQIGLGSTLSSCTEISCYSDFRSADVALGGQGAPLVPIGDKLLFSDYDACINLGGFANISFMQRAENLAFDICPLNLLLNEQASKLGYSYDSEGQLARSGEIHLPLLQKLNALPFYAQNAPKSLGAEWIITHIQPILNSYTISEKDFLATLTEHMADQISKNLNAFDAQKALITGGGAYNKYLLERIEHKAKAALVIPDAQTIEFKEALIFAFLAVLAHRKEVNVLSSITGASRDHSAGVYHTGNHS
jgi:anhydro-N-acetylmuramic acid kinase